MLVFDQVAGRVAHRSLEHLRRHVSGRDRARIGRITDGGEASKAAVVKELLGAHVKLGRKRCEHWLDRDAQDQTRRADLDRGLVGCELTQIIRRSVRSAPTPADREPVFSGRERQREQPARRR